MVFGCSRTRSAGLPKIGVGNASFQPEFDSAAVAFGAFDEALADEVGELGPQDFAQGPGAAGGHRF